MPCIWNRDETIAMTKITQHGSVREAKASPVATRAARKPAPPEPSRLARLQSAYGNQGILRSVKSGSLQRKLTVNQPGDKFEQEADRVADAVMRMPTSDVAGERVSHDNSSGRVQRCSCGNSSGGAGKCEECEAKATSLQRASTSASSSSTAPPVVHEVLGSSGQPLDRATSDFMESRFGQDFSEVRVHTDARAAQSATAVDALAYTVGPEVVFAGGQYSPGTTASRRLLAHELTHVVQQGHATPRSAQNEATRSSLAFSRNSELAKAQVARVLQRAGDPAAIPADLGCPTDLTAGRPAGTEVLFPVDGTAITPAHTALLTAFRATWLAAGGTDDILVHGYASTDGAQDHNWRLSCTRAQAVKGELERLGIPAVRINVIAHGASTDFGAGGAANRHAVVTSHAGFLPLPLARGTLTARDNFAGRSATRFGVGEIIDLNFASIPPRPAADFGGLQWVLVSGGGTLTGVTNAGTATFTAAATAGAAQLELRVAGGATAGRVISTHPITVVIPSAVRMIAVPGTAPGFANPGVVPAGTWGAGFQADPFIDPKDVSFQGVVFGEGTVTSVVTPAGSFLSPFAGLAHPVNTFGPGHGGNATTGTQVSPPVDNITSGQLAPAGSLLAARTCGASDFLWAIPWQFSVEGGTRTNFAGGFTANHHVTSTFFCNATIEKAGAGPFCRKIDGTTC